MLKNILLLWLCSLCFSVQAHPIKNKEKIILLAIGSFNPPTLMHLRMFETARSYIQQNEHVEVIAGVISPAHESYAKETTNLVANNYRRDMVNLSLSSSDWIRLSEWELDQCAWTQSRLVLRYHQNYVNSILDGANVTIPSWLPANITEYRGQVVRIKQLCGADLLDSMTKWENSFVENIMENFGVVAVGRGDINSRKSVFYSDLLYKYKENITIVDNFIEDGISSTVIRRSLRRGYSVKYLIHDDIIQYIHDNDLYDSNLQANNLH